MRWMWTLVVCCLVAVGGARPVQAETRDPYAAQPSRIDVAPAHVLALATRRDTAHAPDFRLPPFVLVTPTSVPSPARVAVTCDPPDLAQRIPLVVAACSARGPPVS